MNVQQSDVSRDIVQELEASVAVKKTTLEQNVETISEIVKTTIGSLRSGKKLLVFGNGGSAADSQHIAAELVSKFRRDRRALAAIALTVDTSILTSISNDYAFDNVFARQIEALGEEGDIALGISTSGNSRNVLRGVDEARKRGMITIGFTGRDGGQLKDRVDLCLRVPSNNTARIQEVHMTVAHAMCASVEKELCD